MDVTKEGAFVVFASFAMMLVLIILSTGYSPDVGFLTSFLYGMNIFSMHIGCEEGTFISREMVAYNECSEGFVVVLYTKYLISILLISAVYGVGQMLKLFPSVVWWRKS